MSTTTYAQPAHRPARPAPAPLRASFTWALSGNVVYAASQWGVLVALARLGSPSDVGVFALATGVTAPVFLLAGLQLRASQATDAAGRHPFQEYLAVRVAGMAAALAATAALAGLPGQGASARLTLLAVGASKAVEGLSDVYHGALQRQERMGPIARSLAARGVLGLGAMGAALGLGAGLPLAVAAMATTWAAVLLLYDRPAALALERREGAPLDGRSAVRLVKTCLPLGFVIMLVSLRANVPRLFVERHAGPAELGIFAASTSLLVAGTVVVSALGQAATPRLARLHHARDLSGFRALVGRLLGVAGALGAAGILVAAVAGERVLDLLFGAPYATRAGLLVGVMALGALSFAGSVLGYALTTTRRFGLQLPLFAASTALCAAACAVLVPAHGLAGALVGWGAALGFELVVTGALLALTLRRPREGS